MTNIFAEIARKETTLSPLMAGKARFSTKDMRERYAEGVTVTAFDIVENGGSPYAVFLIAEEPDCFVFGGEVMTKICIQWVTHFDGDIQAANDAMKESGGVRLKFGSKTTKSNRTVTTVEVIG